MPNRTSTDRVLGLLDLFTEATPAWTVEGMAAALGLARTTAYRYARTLTGAGFLTTFNAGVYVLGPRIVELDRLIRLNDPLLQVAPPLMNAVRKRAGGIQLLCVYYGDHVLCVHDVREDRDVPSGFDRGRPFPLFKGGPSKVILANLSSRQQKELMLHHAVEISRAGLGDDWSAFNANLMAIRKTGYFAARGELNADTYGISAPIMQSKGLAGVYTIGRRLADLSERELPVLVALTVDTAARISQALQAIDGGEKSAPA